jgi:hypothetical protein
MPWLGAARRGKGGSDRSEKWAENSGGSATCARARVGTKREQKSSRNFGEGAGTASDTK